MNYDLIFVFFGNIICYLNLIWIYSKISEHNFRWTMKLCILLLLSSGVLTYITFLNIVPLKTMFSLLILILNIKILYQDETDYLIIISSFVWLMGMLLDIIFMFSFSFVFNKIINFDINRIEHIAMYISTILLHIIYNLISRLTIFKIISKKTYKILKKLSLVIMLSIVICMVLIGAYSVVSLNNSNKLILLLLLILFAVWLIVLKTKLIYLNKITKETNKLLLKNNDFYVKLNNETRKFKHNLIHDLNGLKVYGNKKINLLIDEIVVNAGLLVSVNQDAENLPMGINGIILQRIYQFDNNDITIKIDNSFDGDIFDLISPKTYNHLCKILGVSIDNALEASSKSVEKIIYFVITEEVNNISISILNTFSSILDLDRLGAINYTTKGKNHGIGLFSILGNKEIKTSLKIINNLFEVKIKIRKQKKYD